MYGVLTGHRDARGRWHESPRESVVLVLEALGAPGALGAETDLRDSIESRKIAVGDRVLEPVLVAWEGVLPSISLRLPAAGRGARRERPGTGFPGRHGLRLTLILEGGEERQWEARWDTPDTAFLGAREELLPLGYHRLKVEAGGFEAEAAVICAPRRCCAPGADSAGFGRPCTGGEARELGESRHPDASQRRWGVFAPLYALRSETDWGAGDLATLGRLSECVGNEGGSVVATLPLLATYLEQPFDPAPYRPVSRLFWNEFYLSVEQIEEWNYCLPVREFWASAEVQSLLVRLRAETLVDYERVTALKRHALEELSRCFFRSAEPERREKFARYVGDHPDVREYAAFRARAEAAGAEEAEQYHLFCQWQMEEQLARLSQGGAGRVSSGLLLDLPVGVHPRGFDTLQWPELFATGMSIGAPPDSFFAQGQDWSSPPLHPEMIRQKGHQYFARSVRNHMRHATYLRIDHVMSLHRLFWVPEGREPADGVYVTYPAEELYAVLCLESCRSQTVVVGEDLGTVPPGVRASMRRHGLLGTWVLQGSLRPRATPPVGSVPRRVMAALGTHDMFPFAGFLRGDDIRARVKTGQIDGERARRDLAARHRLVAKLAEFLMPTPGSALTSGSFQAATASAVVPPNAAPPNAAPSAAALAGEAEAGEAELLRRALAYLASSPAALVLVNLDDLLHETEPQNLPGTGAEWANWRRKLAGGTAEVERAIQEAGRDLGAGRSAGI